MSKPMKHLSILLALMLGIASAQSLAELAPADTVLSLGWQSSGENLGGSLGEDLAALPWEEASEVIASIAEVVSEVGADPDLEMMLETFENAFNSDDPYADFVELCPAAEPLVPEFEVLKGEAFASEALLSVSVSPFSPVPAATALLRVPEGDYSELLVELRGALLECYIDAQGGTITTLDEGGVTLYVVGDAGDFPIVAGNAGGLFFLGTNPEAVRSVLRKRNGANEASLASAALYQEALSRFAQGGNSLSLTLDFAAIADALEGLTGFVIDGPETAYLVERGLAVLRTLGGYAGQLSAGGEGVISEGLFAVNPEGGDAALADYILCETCRVSAPFLAPEGVSAVTAAYIPWRDLIAYAETWVDGYAAVSGESLDLRALIQDELGLDLDVALFNWLGSEIHSYTLEPFDTDLETLFYGQPQVSVIPVSSPEAAQAGIDEWAKLISPDMLDEFLDDPEFGQFVGMLAAETYEYEGFTVNRYRYSVNGDLGYSLVGNYLVLGSPVASVERVIDTFGGGRFALSNPAVRELRTAGDTLTTYSYTDVSANLGGVADLLELFVQPAAFATRLGLEAILDDALFAQELNFENLDVAEFAEDVELGYPADIAGLEPSTLAVGENVSGSIEASELDNLGYNTDFYELTGLNPGDEVTVTFRSEDFDTYLWLIDADDELYITENDDAADDFSASEVSFVAEEGVRYWVELSSYSGEDLGEYSLAAELTPGAVDAGANADVDLSAVTPAPLALEDELSAELSDVTYDALGYNADFYELTGFAPGDEVTVRLESDVFDTYIWLIDAETGTYLAENDDFRGRIDASELSFVAEEGARYLVQVSDFSQFGSGGYTVSLRAGSASALQVSREDLPSFAQLLDFYALLPEALHMIAERVGAAQSYSLIENGVVYQRQGLELDW